MVMIVALWICLCAALNCLGWFLSAISQLNAGSYLIALSFCFAVGAVWFKKTGTFSGPRFSLGKLSRRFCRPFPCFFLILASLAFIGGAIYPPNNFDGVTYR